MILIGQIEVGEADQGWQGGVPSAEKCFRCVVDFVRYQVPLSGSCTGRYSGTEPSRQFPTVVQLLFQADVNTGRNAVAEGRDLDAEHSDRCSDAIVDRS